MPARLGRRWNIDPAFRNNISQTPYLAFSNSPIYMKDPSGRDDFVATKDGEITRTETKSKTHSYYYVNDEGKKTLLAEITKKGNKMVGIPLTGYGYEKALINAKNSLNEDAAAAFFAVAAYFHDETGATLRVNQFTTEGGSHSDNEAYEGKALDIKYVSKTGGGTSSTSPDFDKNASQKLVNMFASFGFSNSSGRHNILTENNNKGPALEGTHFPTNTKAEHKSHFHLQHYNSNHIRVLNSASSVHVNWKEYYKQRSEIFEKWSLEEAQKGNLEMSISYKKMSEGYKSLHGSTRWRKRLRLCLLYCSPLGGLVEA